MSKKYVVMLFDTEVNLGVSIKPNRWVNVENKYFDNGSDALYYYTHSGTPMQDG